MYQALPEQINSHFVWWVAHLRTNLLTAGGESRDEPIIGMRKLNHVALAVSSLKCRRVEPEFPSVEERHDDTATEALVNEGLQRRRVREHRSAAIDASRRSS